MRCNYLCFCLVIGCLDGCIAQEETMQLFEAQFERLKKASGADTDTAFASFLGLRQGSISGAKKKRQVPHAWFFQVAEKTGVSANWLFWGRGPMQISDAIDQDDESTAKTEYPREVQTTPTVAQSFSKLEHELEQEREERRELAAENRRLYREKEELLKELGELRATVARLEERKNRLAVANGVSSENSGAA